MNEDNKLIYREQQRFTLLLRWLVYTSMGLAMLLSILSLREMSSGQGLPGAKEILSAVLVGLGVPIAIVVLFLILRLETEVRSDGLYVRYYPFHISFRKFSPDDLSECHARQYRPIREFGGWGIRCGLFGKGKAYNVSGNKGVQLVFKNGKRLLIGSQKAEEFEEALRKIIESK
jgi:hypothetical protein